MVASHAGAQEGPIDLLSQYDIRYDGVGVLDLTGESIAGGGDVNDDGTPDFLIAARRTDHNLRQDSGSIYVVFGDPSETIVDLGDLGTGGFRIDGAAAFEQIGGSLSMTGDVNDDGFDDIVIGARDADNNERDQSGSAYVVFGKESTTNVDLNSLGVLGFRIDGAEESDFAGGGVGGGGDFNDDGIADVIVGAAGVDGDPTIDHGAAYVIFGSETPANIDLASLGAAGIRILGEDAADTAGVSVANGGQIDDDGIDDIIVGAVGTDNNSLNGAGSVYVVFGSDTPANIDLESLGSGGFRIDGQAESPGGIGHDVAGGADIDGDELNDVLVSQQGANNVNGDSAGGAYVVFGKATSTNVDLASLDEGGFRIDGAAQGDFTGRALAMAGDTNDDGLGDMIVGAPQADQNSRDQSGSAYVVFGKDTTSTVDLSSFEPAEGYRIDGPPANDGAGAGTAVAGAGDINEDDHDDVLVAATQAAENGVNKSGSVYLDLASDWLPGACANPRSGTDDDDTLIGSTAGDDITGGDGADDLSGGEGEDCVKGEKGADTVKGGENADTVKGGDGDDPSIKGGDGNDTLEGGKGKDTLEGGNGKDDLEGGKAKDTLEGGDKGDTLDGGEGDDTLKGEEGDDTLKGGADADTLKGGDGKDTLKGGDGGDTLEGGGGKDTITGGGGKDTIKAGAGNDDIRADDGKKDTIKCGSGNDTVDADNKDVLIGC